MPRVLVVTDSAWVDNDVRAALSTPDYELSFEADPAAAAARAVEFGANVALVDMQVTSMGGMAITRAFKEAESVDGAPEVPVVLMLDRQADAFLAKRAGAAAWLRKPFTAFELRDALDGAIGEAPG